MREFEARKRDPEQNGHERVRPVLRQIPNTSSIQKFRLEKPQANLRRRTGLENTRAHQANRSSIRGHTHISGYRALDRRETTLRIETAKLYTAKNKAIVYAGHTAQLHKQL